MIKCEFIEIKLNPRHLSHFRGLGYKDIKTNQTIQILTEHLPQNSNIKLEVACDICHTEKYIKYQDYNKHTNNRTEKYYCHPCSHEKNKITSMKRYGVSSPMKLESVKNKLKEVMMENYGVDSYSKTDEYKRKYKETCLERFGVDNSFKSEKIKDNIRVQKRKSMEDKNLWIPIKSQSDFNIYKNKVRRLTREISKLMQWDGLDFYDKEYIKDNFSFHWLHNNYPTIDHKISIYDGFINKIPAENIAGIENLCWTKRIINITKNRKST